MSWSGRAMVAGLRRAGRPPVTVRYPHEREAPVAGARNSIGLVAERCIVCHRCQSACPTACIEVAGEPTDEPPGRVDRFVLDAGACVTCGRCIDVCPTDALVWQPADEHAVTARDALAWDLLSGER